MKVYKRILSILLGITMVITMALQVSPLEAQAGTSVEELAAIVEPQIRTYADSLDKNNADTEAAKAMARYGLIGQGKTLKAGKTHMLTATLMNSELAQKAMISGCVEGIKLLENQELNSVWNDGGCYWGSSKKYCTTTLYADEKVDLGNMFYTSGVMNFDGTLHEYDNSLVWMVGSMQLHMTITKKTVTSDMTEYHVVANFEDRFDFDTNEGSIPREIASLMGSLLFKEYDWIATTEFMLKVPNKPVSGSSNYHWKYDAETQDMISITTDGMKENKTTKIDASTNGKKTYYYELDQMVLLKHNVPWELEYIVKNPGHFAIAQTQVSKNPLPYLLTQYGTHFFLQRAEWLNSAYRYHCYGYTFANLFAYSKEQTYTVKLENVIESDGSNMIYVSVYNNDLQKTVFPKSPLDDYYWNDKGVLYNQSKESRDLNGVDLRLSFIGNKTYPFSAKSFELIIREKGKIISGDADGDSEITGKDVIAIRRHLAGGYEVTVNLEASDVNNDGEVNGKDVIAIRRYLAGGYGVELM